MTAPPATRRRRRDRRRGPLDLLALLPVLALAAFMVWEARLFFVADMNLLEARWLIGAWASGERPMTPASWLRAYDATHRAIDTHPEDANLRVQMGVLYQMAGTLQQNADQRQSFLRQSAGQYRRALAVRPSDGWSWATLAELLQSTEPGSPAAWDAWRQAQRHAPLEDAVQLALLRAGFIGWAQAPADVKSWLTAHYEHTPPAQRQEIDNLALAWGAPEWRGPVAAAPPAVDLEKLISSVQEALDKGLPLPPPPMPPDPSASAP